MFSSKIGLCWNRTKGNLKTPGTMLTQQGGAGRGPEEMQEDLQRIETALGSNHRDQGRQTETRLFSLEKRMLVGVLIAGGYKEGDPPFTRNHKEKTRGNGYKLLLERFHWTAKEYLS